MGVTSAPARIAEFREALAAGVLTAGGAMGSMLVSKLGSRGAYFSRCLDELNLSLPALVRDVHQEYLRAGARILGTNTFGANRKRLARFGFAEKTRAINQAGVRIAREAARVVLSEGPMLSEGQSPEEAAFVAGVVGPLGVRLEPLGRTTRAEARVLFREQMDTLVEAGVDLLSLETFQDLNELHEAILAAREAAGPAMIVVAHVSVEEDGSLACGASPQETARLLDAWPVDVIGLNCSFGPTSILEAIEKMAALLGTATATRPLSAKPISAMPGAGLPAVVDGRTVYPCSPEYMASFAPRFARLGARIVGGCCGTTPEHIREIRNALDRARGSELSEVPRSAAVVEESAEPGELQPVPIASRSALGAALAARRFVTGVAMLPPRGAEPSQAIAEASGYKEAGVDFVWFAEAPPGSARWTAAAACQVIHSAAGIECVLHVRGAGPTRGEDLAAMQDELLGAHALGIRNVLCDVGSIGYPSIAANLNRGLDLGGHPLGSGTALLIGVAIDPCAADLEEEFRRFELAVKAGADYALTLPVFDLDFLDEFLKRLEPYRLPVIAGIRPLTGVREAEYLINERRTPVPEAYLERLSAAPDAEAEGLAIAREMARRVQHISEGNAVAGICFSGRFGMGQLARELAASLAQANGSRPRA